jgi:CheY-like chemotaxis protein
MVTYPPVGCRVHGRAVEQKRDPRRVATCARDWPRRPSIFQAAIKDQSATLRSGSVALGKSIATMWQSAACDGVAPGVWNSRREGPYAVSAMTHPRARITVRTKYLCMSGPSNLTIIFVVRSLYGSVREFVTSTQEGRDMTTLDHSSVLIVDDHPGTLTTYSTILRLSGFKAATATTGRAGLEIAMAGPFAAILVDLRLPDLPGIDVVRELRDRNIRAPIVIVTAFPTIESSFDAAAAGADGYIDGPLFGDEVSDVVEQAVHGPYPVVHPTRRRRPERTLNRRSDCVSAIDGRVRRAMTIIDADLSRTWSISELASQVGLSASRLRYLCGIGTGLSFTAYIRERRLQEAAPARIDLR